MSAGARGGRRPGGRVAVVGSLNMDLVVRAPRLPKPGETLSGHGYAQAAGGKGGNQAVAAARLGARVAMLGRLGDDANGAALRAALEAEQIDCAALATSAGVPTGVALIVVDDASQNAIVIVAGGNGLVTPEDVAAHDAMIAAADVLVCQLETPLPAVRAALEAGRRHACSVVLNPAPALAPLPDGWLPLVDWLIPNEIEAAALTGVAIATPADAELAARQLAQAGARNVIVTLGGQGVVARQADGSTRHYPAPKVEAVDTTAAGDTFIGGFAARLAAGETPDEAIRFALRAAALSVTRAGAQPSIPTLQELSK
ncbi:ribokinase [Burkholderia glumae]|uniref:Ribokinase n=1 Tax=Burkholderia glumae TaxID=337 RepID=A0AAQ0BVF8_BURGL|nr:ribokinase [Burkholderia glumae]AJY65955.1 ribokinase [Burkholderia glumae LMG 2196 = ATCC 33617]KHJ60767.1 ribokinase [Burkholderia glumae]MCM2483170.1 ribokinase [Burkholderia glumae]MCM2493375.1 ribokinase [Burkholderia glumae]MCM2506487.1 ribokinase [Burkholderia glumae]